MVARTMAESEMEKRPKKTAGTSEPPKDAPATAPADAPATIPSAPPAASKHPSSRPVEAAKPASVPPATAPFPPAVAAAPEPIAVPPPVAMAAATSVAPSHPSSRPAAAAKPASVPPATAAPITAAPVTAPVSTEPMPDTIDDAVTAANAAPVAPVVEPPVPAKATSFPPAARGSSKPPPLAGGPLGAYEALARSARLPDLVAITQKVLGEAAAARRAGWHFTSKVAVIADEARLAPSEADTPFGNALKVLGSGAEGELQRSLAAALWAHAIAESRRDDVNRLAGDLLWLATHSSFDATPLLDRALGDEADDLWAAIAERIRRIDESSGTALGRGEALLGCAALAASESAAARRIAAELAPRVNDATLVRLLGVAAVAPLREVRLEGEAIAAPRSLFVTAVLALTGILFAMHAVRLVARLALSYRNPSEISLSDAGVRMKTRTEMLGRTLREREHVIVRSGLVRVVREVRYPRAGFYAGLLALAVGSYIGVRAFVDGVRAASPSLLLSGLVVVALGIAADFVLGTLLPGSRGRVRIAFIPRTGKTLCLADVDATRADAALTQTLSGQR